MRGPLSLARGPFSFIMTPSGLFCSLVLHSTILSASGPFSIACVAHVDSILSNVCTSARRMRTFFVLADLLYVMFGPLSLARGAFSFIVTPSGPCWSLALLVRTILSASGPFSIACVAHVVSIISNYGPLPAASGPFSFARTFLLSCADLCSSHADRFNLLGPRLDFSVHSRFACGPFSP